MLFRAIFFYDVLIDLDELHENDIIHYQKRFSFDTYRYYLRESFAVGVPTSSISRCI